MTDQVRATTLLPSLMESTPGITPEEITGASFGPFQRVRIICLDSRLNTAMQSERTILLHQNPTFEHVQRELAAKEPEWTVLQPIYGPNPYWKHADQNSSIGATCRSLYAINMKVNRRYVLAVVRTSQSDRPLPIFETPEAIIQAIVAANPVLENKIESFTRYSDLQDARTELFDYDRLKERERFSFPTAFILTMREPPQDFRCTVPSAIIPPFLQIPFVNCKNLLRLTYNLELFPLQMIHVSRALLHAIISLAEAFKPVRIKDTSDPHPEDVREVALVLADELEQFLDSLTQILKHGDERFNQSNTQNTINQTFIALCGDYPGAVNIRRSQARFEELTELDREEAELSSPIEAVRTVEEGPVVPRWSEQDELVGRSDTIPVEPVRNTKERPGVILAEPALFIRDNPVETVRMVDKGHSITPVEGFDVGEEELDSVPSGKVTDEASQSFTKKSGVVESSRRFLKAQKMQNFVPVLLTATSWAAPLVEFRQVAVETVDKGPITNPVEGASDNTNVPLIAANLSPQTIAHENIAGDIDGEISEYRTILETTTDDDLNKPMLLNHLAVRLESRFRRSDTVDDLQEAASSLQTAVELTPDDHPAKPALLTNLGNVLQTRSVRIGDLADADKAISSLKNATELTPDGHPNKPSLLYSLGSTLLLRFRWIGNLEDLNQAILLQETAMELTPDDYLDRHTILNSVANALRIRFERIGDLEDIRRAIASLEIAANLTPNQHPDKAGSLSDLGTALRSRFDWLGNLEDLENAVSNLQQADQLTHDGNPDKPAMLSNLGNALKSRFDRLGSLVDLEDAILNQQKAVELTPEGHPDMPGWLSNLVNALESRFYRLGSLADLEDAVLNQQKAVKLTPDDHPDKPARLSNLVNALESRFYRLGSLTDLEDAVLNQQKAVKLTPDDHPDKPARLSNLGNALKSRFDRLGSLTDLEDAISSQRKAVELTPDGHPDKPARFSNLGNALKSRFDRFGSLTDLEDAISSQQKAVELTPDGHPGMPGWLSNLGNALESRFDRLGSLTDLEDAISRQQKAVEITPDGHPGMPGWLNNLGSAFFRRFRRLSILSDLESGLSAFSTAANSTSGSAMVRFKAARTWAKVAEENSRSPLGAFSRAIDLLPRIAWLGLTVTDQHSLLTDVGGTVCDAVAAAIRFEEYETAAVWAEQGRSIVWQNLLGFRSPVDKLREAHPELANRLRGIAAQMEGSFPHEPLDNEHEAPVDVSHRYKLAFEWDNLIEEVRRLPTFEGFMKAKTFRQLAPAADEGPVVILNVSDTQCDALVLIADGSTDKHVSVVNIPLERFSHEQSKELSQSVMRLLTLAGVRGTFRKIASQEDGDVKFKAILGKLWQDVVKPVIEGLAFQTESKRPPRIWWCATGSLTSLPIHAAGLYDTPEMGEKLSDYAVSSYTPTLTAILELPDPVVREGFQVLTVAQPSVPGVPPIPKTEDEVQIVQSLVAGARTLNLKGEDATAERVQEGMMQSDWIHLACHGKQNHDNPMESGFVLHDKILKLSEIVKMSPPNADFAFLSSCEGAMGDEKLREESIHLAAGMLLLGYRGVITTAWFIRDEDGPKIAQDVYSRMFKDGKPNRKEAAYALHEAVKLLRESGAPCTSWVPFIHMGR